MPSNAADQSRQPIPPEGVMRELRSRNLPVNAPIQFWWNDQNFIHEAAQYACKDLMETLDLHYQLVVINRDILLVIVTPEDLAVANRQPEQVDRLFHRLDAFSRLGRCVLPFRRRPSRRR